MKNKTKYVDGFVLVVPKKNLSKYELMAKEGAKMWMKHGALDYKECVIDDKKPKGITLTFTQMTKAKPTDVVIFSYITYKSRKHRDEVNKKVMSDASMDKYKDTPMPFDIKRMAYAGFQVLVSA